MKPFVRALISAMALAVVACATDSAVGRSDHGQQGAAPVPGAVMTRERQSRITPEIALKMLQEGNDRFLAGKLAKRDLHEQVKMTGHGQFPFASVVSCIDSRAAPEVIFDQGVGDIFTARVAGNVVNRDIIGSLEYGSKVAGARVIVIMGHTHCGAVKGICDNVKMGNLTDLLEKLRPAMDSVPEDGTPRNSKNASFVDRVAEANVHRQVRQLLSDSPVLRGLVSEGKLMVVGAMLDVETGRVTFFENHDPAEQMAVHDSLHL